MQDPNAPSAGRPDSAEKDELSIHTILERRPGMGCAVQRRETSAALLTTWNELKGPLAIAPALEFVRDHQRFRPSDLPRLRDEASRIVLARWLIREGFLRVAADQEPGQELPQRRAAVARDDQKKGSLVIVGSGIKSLAQMTLEARSWLERADVIFYLLADPASEVWIQKNYPGSIDLSRLYSEHIQRHAVYAAMVETMVRPVREGKTVCSIFYGHPGVFVTPTHEAIKAARAEGYSARMLPGVSASDYLYADVGFNPSEAGIQFYEATDLLVYNRPLHPENNVVIWQIGLVGNPTSLEDYSKLPILIDYLYKFYDPECEVAHYQGSVFSTCDSVVEWLPLRELGKGARVTSMSTLYIPPQRKPQLDQDMVQRLGLAPSAPQSEEAERAKSVKPRVYEGTPSRSALADFIAATATDPDLLTRFEQCPESVAAGLPLTEDERGALLTRMQGRIWAAIKNAAPPEPSTE
jgi:Tetrapyrrole (Corrin/Porphyrin) Methylases